MKTKRKLYRRKKNDAKTDRKINGTSQTNRNYD